MFQFPEFAPTHLCIQCAVAGFTGSGFPIRTSPVQSLCSNSPKLFAATNVLHRLLVPRHSPYTLSSLALFFPKAPTSFTTRQHARRTCRVHSNFNLSLTFDCQRAEHVREHGLGHTSVGSLKSKLSNAVKRDPSYGFLHRTVRRPSMD